MQIVGGNQLSWSDAAARRFCATNALLQSLLFIFNIYAGIVTPGSRLTPSRDDDKCWPSWRLRLFSHFDQHFIAAQEPEGERRIVAGEYRWAGGFEAGLCDGMTKLNTEGW